MIKMIFFIFFIYSFSIENIIKNAIYNIIYKDLFFKYNKQKLELLKSSKAETNSNFRIKKVPDKLKSSFYFMQISNINQTLFLSENNELEFIDKLLLDNKKDLASWNFIKYKDNNYIIKNKNQCLLKVKNLQIKCEYLSFDEATKFNLIKIYEEVEHNELDNKLIEKEPIDVLIKFIDLRDPLLNREKIHQIKKDFDNEEIRYSVRSIIKNIPWVRKIFILMPNEKVRYFKEYDLIKEKIIYVKDKDLIGFDSSSSLAFQFRYWKMKEFGISDNFIVMDDDYFIGAPLKKNDFFYVYNNRVIPSIITSNFIEIKEFDIQRNYDELKLRLKKSKEEQTSETFDYSIYLTYLFFLKKFNKTKNSICIR